AKVAADLRFPASSGWEDCCAAAAILARCVGVAEQDTRLPVEGRGSLVNSYAGQVRKLVDEVLTQHGDQPAAKDALARFLATSAEPRLRDASQAVTLAQQAVERAPKAANYWNTLGIAHYRAGDGQAAIAALHKAIELEGAASSDRFFLAMA